MNDSPNSGDTMMLAITVVGAIVMVLSGAVESANTLWGGATVLAIIAMFGRLLVKRHGRED